MENKMKLIIIYIIIILAVSAFNISAQTPDFLQRASSDVFLSYSNNKLLSVIELDSIKSILNAQVDKDKIEQEYLTTQQVYDSLRISFGSFESTAKTVSADSAMFLFNQWYLHFTNTFYNYFLDKFSKSGDIKIIFFSASVSCYCTLEMCHNQLLDFLKFIEDKDGKYAYLVVDSYEHTELQVEYDTFFAPSIVLLDKDNKVLIIFEYDEKAIIKLTEYVAANDK